MGDGVMKELVKVKVEGMEFSTERYEIFLYLQENQYLSIS